MKYLLIYVSVTSGFGQPYASNYKEFTSYDLLIDYMENNENLLVIQILEIKEETK